jgi:hypothetical protein
MENFKFLKKNQEVSNDNRIFYLNTNRIPSFGQLLSNDEQYELLFQFDDENPVLAASFTGPRLTITLAGGDDSNIIFTDATSNKTFKLFSRKIQNQTA